MYCKEIEYVDYNDVPRKEKFYFNLNESELTEMQLTHVGGMDGIIKKIIETRDVPELIRIFKYLLLKSYGEKSADGKRFIKSDELSTAFSQTEAYNKFFMELATDDGKAAEFINGIVPKNVSEQLAKNPDLVASLNNETGASLLK